MRFPAVFLKEAANRSEQSASRQTFFHRDTGLGGWVHYPAAVSDCCLASRGLCRENEKSHLPGKAGGRGKFVEGIVAGVRRGFGQVTPWGWQEIGGNLRRSERLPSSVFGWVAIL